MNIATLNRCRVNEADGLGSTDLPKFCTEFENSGRSTPVTGEIQITLKFTLLGGGIASGARLVASPILAHHGTNISYDHSKPTTLKGTVTEFVWSNPHCQLYFDVKDADGKVINWAGELNSPSVLGREGWTKHHFKAGDQITITVFPSKAGAPVGVVDRTHPILADGKEVVPANARNVD